MRSLNRLIAAAILAAAPIGCTPSSGLPGPSAGQGAIVSADSKAADLRVRLDLLLGEHVMMVAKESLAAGLANRTDEYRGYASLLTTNGNDLTSVMASAFGASAAAQFDKTWKIGDGYLVDYTIGLVTHNSARSNAAMSGLRNGFVPQLVQFVASNTQLSVDRVSQLLSDSVSALKALIDDQVTRNNTAMYVDLRAAYGQSAHLGDALASAIAQRFQDKFPGDPANKAVDFRVSLMSLLQEHAYLATMTTDATAGKRSSEQVAGLGSLAANAGAMGALFANLSGASTGTRFGQVWGARDAELVVYCDSSDVTNSQAALSSLRDTFVPQFAAFVHDMTGADFLEIAAVTGGQLEATIRVVDDQKGGQFTRVAADDRTSAAEMQQIADLIATSAVSKQPAKFA